MNEQEAKLSRLRTEIRELSELMKTIVEDPTILRRFSHTQVAWMMEQLEMLIAESRDLEKKIKELLEIHAQN